MIPDLPALGRLDLRVITERHSFNRSENAGYQPDLRAIGSSK